MPLRPRALPAGFIPPCLPMKAPQPPFGAIWLHEIKWDGFRVIARKIGKRVRLYSRPGNDLTYRFPLIVQALARLRSRSCIIDGEAITCGQDGMANFNRIRYRLSGLSIDNEFEFCRLTDWGPVRHLITSSAMESSPVGNVGFT